MDGAGTIYLVWQTRSFRVGSVASTPNDIALTIMAAPTDAQPNPPFGARPASRSRPTTRTRTRTTTSSRGSRPTRTRRATTAHLGLFYYNYSGRGRAATSIPENPANQCELRVGFVSSTDGGATWSDPLYLASMGLPDLVRSSQGLMVGDYSTADVIPAGPNAGNAISAFAIGLTDKTLNQPMFVPKNGIPITGSARQASEGSLDAGGDQRGPKAEGVPGHAERAPSVP